MLGSFNKWNIIKLSHKETSSEDIDKLHQVVLYVISDNIYELVKPDKYGAINTKDKTTVVCNVIKFIP